MKKILFLSAAALLTFVAACKKDKKTDGGSTSTEVAAPASSDVANRQRSFMAYVTATWCGPCGMYGGPTFKQVISDIGDDVIALNVQTSNSQLTSYFKKNGIDNPDSTFIGPAFNQIFPTLNIPTSGGSFSIPAFSVNNNYLGTSNTTVDQLKGAITGNNANSPEIGIAANMGINGNTLTVKAKAKAFKDATANEFIWTVAILETPITGYQLVGSAANNSYEHKNIVRAVVGSGGKMYNQNLWNATMASTSVKANAEFDKTFTFDFQNYTSLPAGATLQKWTSMTKSNTKVAVMVWRKMGTTYTFVNGVYAH